MVTVTFNVDDKDSEDEVNFPEADNFGISNTGDLILVKLQSIPGPAGQPQQVRGNNTYAFAAGTWSSARVEPGIIQTPPGVIMTPGQT